MVFSQSHMHAQVGNSWLHYAKLCRLAGHYETAHLAILEADASGAPDAHMEKAKYLWNIRKFDSAIAELQQTLLNMPAEILEVLYFHLFVASLLLCQIHLSLRHRHQKRIQMCLKPCFSTLDGSTIQGKNRVRISNLSILE